MTMRRSRNFVGRDVQAKAFTLIELLIVVVIIGVLAAIAIPPFTNTKQKAFDVAAQSDIRNLMTAQEAYFFSHQSYASKTDLAPGAAWDLDDDGTTDFQASKNVTVKATADTASNGYRITAKHGSSPDMWCVNTSTTADVIGQIVKDPDC